MIIGLGGLNNYPYYGSIFLVSSWYMVPQMDFKMILVNYPGPCSSKATCFPRLLRARGGERRSSHPCLLYGGAHVSSAALSTKSGSGCQEFGIFNIVLGLGLSNIERIAVLGLRHV